MRFKFSPEGEAYGKAYDELVQTLETEYLEGLEALENHPGRGNFEAVMASRALTSATIVGACVAFTLAGHPWVRRKMRAAKRRIERELSVSASMRYDRAHRKDCPACQAGRPCGCPDCKEAL